MLSHKQHTTKKESGCFRNKTSKYFCYKARKLLVNVLYTVTFQSPPRTTTMMVGIAQNGPMLDHHINEIKSSKIKR